MAAYKTKHRRRPLAVKAAVSWWRGLSDLARLDLVRQGVNSQVQIVRRFRKEIVG